MNCRARVCWWRVVLCPWAGIVFALSMMAAENLAAQSTEATHVVVVRSSDPLQWNPDEGPELLLQLTGEQMDQVTAVRVRHKGVRVMESHSPDAQHLLVRLHVDSRAERRNLVLMLSTRYLVTFTVVGIHSSAAASAEAPPQPR